MRTKRAMLKTALRWLSCVGIISINLAFAVPATADWEDDLCFTGGQWELCCTTCLFFCECELT